MKKTLNEPAEPEQVVEVPVEEKFSKEQIMKSKRFSNRVDALGFLLEDGVEYSVSDVEKSLKDYYKKGMN